MFGNPFKGFPSEVQPIKFRIVPFQRGNDLDRLGVVIEPTKRCHQGVQSILASVSKGRVSQIVGQRDSLGQFRIQSQRPGDRARHLRDLNRVRQPCAIKIALMFNEHLGLVL